MSARRKLNSAYFNGALIVAALLGYATGSVWVFLAGIAIMLATAVNNQDIRFK